MIGSADVLALLASFGMSGSGLEGDLDGNGIVGVDDILAMLSAYGEPCSGL